MTDFAVVGGGIAGVAAAAHLAPHGSLVLLEMEKSLAYHTSGRSAAMFVVNYGSQGFRPLTRASRPFLEQPPDGSTDSPLLSDRGLLWIATEGQLPHLKTIADEGLASQAGTQLLEAADVLELVPALDPDHVAAGLHEPDARDVDVAGLHQAFVRLARRHGAEIRTGARVIGLNRRGNGWSLDTTRGSVTCEVVVNAAGAWGDELAELAGVGPIGLQPMRRTAFMVPGRGEYAGWPLVVDAEQNFYFKPDGVQLLCSLAEEKPSEAADPRPRMEDVALAIERINAATSFGIRTVNSQWTGLRTFAPDRELVVGEDPEAEGFFWLVGQGGSGIASAPAYGELLAGQVLGNAPDEGLLEAGVDEAALSPMRFRRSP